MRDSQRRLGLLVTSCLLGTLAVVLATAMPASATLYPPPIRLARLFHRVEWQSEPPTAFIVPPGHIAERWES